jgi:hypothetical protein
MMSTRALPMPATSYFEVIEAFRKLQAGVYRTVPYESKARPDGRSSGRALSRLVRGVARSGPRAPPPFLC